MAETEGDAYQFEFVSLEGEKLPLAGWRGRPVLVVNTASYCGYTPQYAISKLCGGGIASGASSSSACRPTISASRSRAARPR